MRALALLTLLALFPANDLSWVDQRVQEWQAKPSERKFDQFGWVTQINTALELAKKHNRPVFLFTHDGRMAIGRC